MRWVAGIRSGTLYTVAKRPIDPKWSNRNLQTALAWCATGIHLGWSEDHAFQVAEAIIMKDIYHGIKWPESSLTRDMQLLVAGEQHESE
jgi:hypothetical protein